jgi:hypothetical protein
MSILVIAPTLKAPSGHDHAFCTELVQCGGDSDVRILASDKFQPEPGLPALPFFLWIPTNTGGSRMRPFRLFCGWSNEIAR